MIFGFLILTVSAFLIGFILGVKRPVAMLSVKRKHNDDELLTLQKEYENFLNYDGTEQ